MLKTKLDSEMFSATKHYECGSIPFGMMKNPFESYPLSKVKVVKFGFTSTHSSCACYLCVY